MSNVSGITSGLTESLQSLWQAARQGKTEDLTGTPPAPPHGAEGAQQLWEDVAESAATSGLSSEEIDGLKTELKAAITEAMEAAKQSGDRNAGHAAVDDAILSTLQDYGLDTTEIEEHMAEARNRMKNGPPPGGAPGNRETDVSRELLASLAGSGQEQDTTSLLLSSLSSSSSLQHTASTVLASLFPLLDEEG